MKPFCIRTVRKDGGTRASVCCIECGDDLDPLLACFGRGVWVGVDGRLTGPFFFIALLGLSGDVKKILHTQPQIFLHRPSALQTRCRNRPSANSSVLLTFPPPRTTMGFVGGEPSEQALVSRIAEKRIRKHASALQEDKSGLYIQEHRLTWDKEEMASCDVTKMLENA